jgi:hypothetical protein
MKNQIHVRGSDDLGPIDYKIMLGDVGTTGYIRDQFGSENLFQEEVLFKFVHAMMVISTENYKIDVRKKAAEEVKMWAERWIKMLEEEK